MFKSSFAIGALALAAFGIAAPAMAESPVAPNTVHTVTAVDSAPPSGLPIDSNLLSFLAPVPGQEVDSPFGLRRLPWEKAGRMHDGVDIQAPKGSSVLATAAGIVAKMGVSASYGRFVEIAHPDGLTSIYAHLSKAAADLQSGMEVAQGAVVGFVGSTGHSTGPHLHFEIRKNGEPLNPTVLMDHTFTEAEGLPVEEASYVEPTVRQATASARTWGKKARKGHKGKATARKKASTTHRKVAKASVKHRANA